MGFWSYAASAGTGLTVLWALKSAVAYYTWTLEEMVEDVAASPLPLNDNGVQYWKEILSPYTDLGPVKKRSAIQMHVSITLVMAIGLCLQFMKTIRKKNMSVHRWVGRATLITACLSYPHFVQLLNGFEQQTAKYMEAPILLGIPYFGIKGWLAIRNKQIAEHRANMIMFGACFYFFGVARLVMMAMNLIHSGPWAKYTGLGDWREWTGEDVDDFFGISIALSFQITFGIAAYNAYYVVPGKPKTA
jgi:hypothetical protein